MASPFSFAMRRSYVRRSRLYEPSAPWLELRGLGWLEEPTEGVSVWTWVTHRATPVEPRRGQRCSWLGPGQRMDRRSGVAGTVVSRVPSLAAVRHENRCLVRSATQVYVLTGRRPRNSGSI